MSQSSGEGADLEQVCWRDLHFSCRTDQCFSISTSQGLVKCMDLSVLTFLASAWLPVNCG